MKKAVSLLLGFILIISMAVNTAAIDNFDDTINYLINTVTDPSVASIGGEWAIIGLARSGANVPDGYFDKYYSNVESYVASKNGILHSRKYTEYSRVISALTAIGKNPENVAGYNLVTPILDYDSTIAQGINGSVWALIALDCGSYGTDEIRDMYITHILSKEKENGGWALSDSESSAEADITAMALISLAPYRNRQAVDSAVNRALSVLSEMQNDNGGYTSYGTETSESAAQVLTAISSMGISYNDSRFVKNGKNLIDNVMSYKNSDGSFSHTDESNLMATEQCCYALTAARRLEDNKSPLFDMRDVNKTFTSTNEHINKSDKVNVPQIINPSKTFDDIAEHKNQKEIEALAQRGIINGADDNNFAPDDTMTRAEFAAITVRALGLSLNNSLFEFKDIDTGDWYAMYVHAAYSYKIVNGVSDTEFNPNGTITNEEACTMIARAANLCGLENNLDNDSARNTLAEFTDYTSVSEWAKPSVAFCLDKGISDRSVTEIKPNAYVKRCEIAYMLYNLLKGTNLI